MMAYSNIFSIKLALAFAAFIFISSVSPADQSNALIGPSHDRDFLLKIIDSEKPGFPLPDSVSGITVPHHLLAADLIARGFWAASGKQYKRVIILAPDHFQKAKHAFATDRSSISTVFGVVSVDAVASSLLDQSEELEEIDLSREHGIQVLIPFVKYFFPAAKVVPIAISGTGDINSWKRATKLLSAYFDEDTLVVQSTDYSHYLPVAVATQRDQESMTLIAAGNPDGVSKLIPSDHMDTRGGQFIQMSLQRQVNARPVVVANRSSFEYNSSDQSTTSYVVTIYGKNPASLSRMQYTDQSAIYFGGDVLAGRNFTELLRSKDVREALAKEVLGVTMGNPLIVNLEGVLTSEEIALRPSTSHLMDLEVVKPLFEKMNVRAVSLANNHSLDFGPEGLEGSRNSLRTLNVIPMEHGQMSDFGEFQVLALTMHPPARGGGAWISSLEEVVKQCDVAAVGPLIAFVHWGTEYSDTFTDLEIKYGQELSSCGISAIVGAHPHLASKGVEAISGQTQAVYSMGNLIFDQRSDRSSSSLVELRIFKSGTTFTRVVPMRNLYELGRAVASRLKN